MNNFVMC